MKSKRLKAYLILFGYLILLTIGFFGSLVLDEIHQFDYFAFIGIYIFLILPVALIIYGIISYVLTKSVLMPNLLLLLVSIGFIINLYLLLIEMEGMSLEFWVCAKETAVISGIITAISAVFSLITMLISKIFKAAVKNQPTSDE